MGLLDDLAVDGVEENLDDQEEDPEYGHAQHDQLDVGDDRLMIIATIAIMMSEGPRLIVTSVIRSDPV